MVKTQFSSFVSGCLRMLPNRSQFFLYESVALSCADQTNSSGWRVKRNTSTHKNEECSLTWGKRNETHCFILDLYQVDNGVYWCESGAGACSDAINISVTGGSVILESPALPLWEGEAVTLRCTNKDSPSSNLTAEFYKDGLLIGSSATGTMTIFGVSTSDEGLYKCNISGAGESPDSWLFVPGGQHETLRPHLAHVLLPVVGFCLSLGSVLLLCFRKNLKGKANCDVTYTDVTITQGVQPKSDAEVTPEPALYSTIKPGAT
ncbi:sialoadhesin-like isoform 1-T1 [Odontesthes bonariensis]|uniref:sialoadhesin-like isoform X1 n=2 Tax=Odontesthes bonariensis TaxID=219752 RepID=UPI003F58A234